MANLNIYRAAAFDDGSQRRTCWVTAGDPFYIGELIIAIADGIAAPGGYVKPGPPPPQKSALRTIYLNKADPVFTAQAPFTLSVSYDTHFKPTAVRLVP